MLAAPAPGFAAKGQDDALLAARDALASSNKARLDQAAAKLKGHVLEPYVEYWRLFLRLPAAPAEQVRDFLFRYSDTALAEQLRGDWLKVLGRSRRWELFRAEYPAFAGDDPEVGCYALLGRWEREDESVPGDFRSFWTAPRELPEGCVALARAMLKSGRLGTRDVWERFRVLVDAGLMSTARRLMEYLPRDQAIEAAQLRAVARAPLKFLQKPQPDLTKVRDRELVLAALTLAADEGPLAAAVLWKGKLSETFPSEDRSRVWLMLAVNGAQRHVPEALDWFGEAGDAPLSDEQLAWRARIALRSEKWAEVKASIERMSAVAGNEPAWIYWYGRSERALGNPLESEGYFERIAGQFHFYGRLAAEELGMKFELPPKAAQSSDEEVARVAALPGIQRALALYRAELRTEGTREWLWSIRGMDDRHLLAAAELARRDQVWDRAINTADRTVAEHDFSVRYLAPYRELLAQKARQHELEAPWVLGMVRQESRFIIDANSSAGASGLMQVMRSTAKWAVKRTGVKNFSWSRLREPELNVALGTYYLRHVLDRLDGSPVLAAAAYNAGPTRVRQWRDARPIEGAIFTETIPFYETRDYVKKVMANTVYYAAIFDGQAISLKERLGTIPPRPSPGGVVAMQGKPGE
ncbi:MAG TPA: transglycosylase SLT domain-containing protein [Burkholderiales bacterium]